jgi:hypothetical protein
LFSERRIAFELLRQPHKDAIGVPRPGSWNARRSPAQRGLPAEFSHLSDHESLPHVNTGTQTIGTPTGRKPIERTSHSAASTTPIIGPRWKA